jgi:poly-gamma-glutamate synthesis protein (capsule biosynthesis protein)
METYIRLYLKRNKIYNIFILCSLCVFAFSGCKKAEEKLPIVVKEETSIQSTLDNTENTISPNPADLDSDALSTEVFSYINEQGTTLDTRISVPNGYTRIPSDKEEMAGFLRSLPLKEDNSEVLLYDGTPKSNQEDHVAVFSMDVGDRDLQQCADSVIRVYAEYYWSIGAYDKIAFHLTNGFLMEYTKWRDGNRLEVNGNDVSWSKTAEYDDSYDCFIRYLTMVFTYAGTLSFSEECEPTTLKDLRPGDMFLQGGSPGHCVLVVDIALDEEGNRCYLLAQGYMPAQEFHIVKNPLHPEDPWYYSYEINYPLQTPSYTFQEGSMVRWSEFPLKQARSINTSTSKEGSSVSNEAAQTISTNYTVGTETASSINLLAVGDNLIHLEVIQSGEQEDGTYNFDHLYANLKDDISAADIAIINQETILGGDDFAYSGYPAFNSPTEIGEAVADAGFDVVLHATNHTMDKGLKAVETTFAFWKQYPHITVLGINETKEQAQTIPIIEKNGIRLAMLNYTFSLNGYSLPEDKPYLVNMLDQKKMTEDIKKAEELADFTIVFPHWGLEYIYEPTKSQKELTQMFYDLGVDLVIGTHPHVLEPVEWIGTDQDHEMLVYYSLGNFMSYQKEAPRMLGGMATITITKDLSGTYISDSDITPIITHYEHGPADFNYGIYKLSQYNETYAKLHGVSKLAQNGPLYYNSTVDLAKEVLGSWYH